MLFVDYIKRGYNKDSFEVSYIVYEMVKLKIERHKGYTHLN